MNTEKGISVKHKRRLFKDRYDGRLVRVSDPFFRVMPQIMKTRSDAQVFFNEEYDISFTDKYIKQKRKEGYKNLKFLDVIIASYVRTVSQFPNINRFIAGRKVFARNSITAAMIIKKQMNTEAQETAIKIDFLPTDTLFDVMEKINREIELNKRADEKNSTDDFADIMNSLPGFIIQFIAFLMNFLDSLGIMPKSVHSLSPFHTGLFISDLGSLGMKPIYHHIYDFGTTSLFIAFGIKKITEDKRLIDLKIVADERISDGFTFAAALKQFKKYIENPELLAMPPEEIKEDTCSL